MTVAGGVEAAQSHVGKSRSVCVEKPNLPTGSRAQLLRWAAVVVDADLHPEVGAPPPAGTRGSPGSMMVGNGRVVCRV